MNYDAYSEVINGKNTFKTIAKSIKNGGTIGIGWTDERGNHLDIIFKLGINIYGGFQRRIKDNYLFVSIIGLNSIGFLPDAPKMGDYIQEKLQIYGECGEKIKELINGVIGELRR